jgi:glycosyltransferase involved in cell wall biosynthesis
MLDGAVISRALAGAPVRLIQHRLRIPDASVIDLLSEARAIAKSSLVKAAVNLHLEDFKLRWKDAARQNWWIPNQEWQRIPLEEIKHHVDLVLCKTKEAVAIFTSLGFATRYIGFTTGDRRDLSIPREWRALHVAGQSPHKGTHSVISAWMNKPDWPVLDVVWTSPTMSENDLPANIVLHQGHVGDDELRFLQNRSLFHVCPSAVEGFGHTLMEGMSCGACVITTDAPPMNELVESDRGVLVGWESSEPVCLGTSYAVSPESLAAGIRYALSLTDLERSSLCARARIWFETNDLHFHRRLRDLIICAGSELGS